MAEFKDWSLADFNNELRALRCKADEVGRKIYGPDEGYDWEAELAAIEEEIGRIESARDDHIRGILAQEASELEALAWRDLDKGRVRASLKRIIGQLQEIIDALEE